MSLRTASVVLVLTVLTVLTGCGGGSADQSSDDRPGRETASTSPPAPPTSPPTSPPPAAPAFTDLAERCAGQLPTGADPIRAAVLDGPGGLRLRAGVFGARTPGGVAMVLLHQTDQDGLCGWAPFATEAARRGVPSVAFDLCGYGETDCDVTSMGDVADQVELAARLARTRLGATRVVLVGASMGGSQTVRALAQGFRAAGWVDVSGPGEWLGDTLLDLVPRVPVPGLVVHTRSDGAESYADAEALARRTGSDFLDGGTGHGYDLLVDAESMTAVGREVLAYVRSR